jgi:hypothetical protein
VGPFGAVGLSELAAPCTEYCDTRVTGCDMGLVWFLLPVYAQTYFGPCHAHDPVGYWEIILHIECNWSLKLINQSSCSNDSLTLF